MEFIEITEEAVVHPGEYLLYEPKQEIVLCGAFNRKNNLIRALMAGRYLEDEIKHFKKIELSRTEHKARQVKGCKGCKGSPT